MGTSVKIEVSYTRRLCHRYQVSETTVRLTGEADPRATMEDGSDPIQATTDWLKGQALCSLDAWQADEEARLKEQADRMEPAQQARPAAQAEPNGRQRPSEDGGGYKSNGNGGGGYKSSSGGGNYNRSSNGSGGNRGGGGKGNFGPPKEPRHLLGWADRNNVSKEDLSAWGERCGAGTRIMDWSRDDVAAAYEAFK